MIISCPSCQKKGQVDILSETIKKGSRGLAAVSVMTGELCDHAFIVYIDNNFKVRDYFIMDVVVELPALAPNESIEERHSFNKKDIDLDLVSLIKLNINGNLMAHILKSIFSNEKFVVILEHDFLYERIHGFFNLITQNAFDVNLTLISKEEYEENKKKYKEYIVLEGSNIINDNNEIIQPKLLKLENQIVKDFLSESDLFTSLMLLRNEIQKVYKFSKTIAEYAKEYKGKDKINLNTIQDHLKETYDIKIQKTFLSTLIDIVKEYFGIKIIKLETVQDLFDSF